MVGAHTSLFFSAIQHFLQNAFWMFWRSLLRQHFSFWPFISVALFFTLGLPFCFWDPISFGHDLIQLHLFHPSHMCCRSRVLTAHWRRIRRSCPHRACHWWHKGRRCFLPRQGGWGRGLVTSRNGHRFLPRRPTYMIRSHDPSLMSSSIHTIHAKLWNLAKYSLSTLI